MEDVLLSYDSAGEHSGGLSNGEYDGVNMDKYLKAKQNLNFNLDSHKKQKGFKPIGVKPKGTKASGAQINIQQVQPGKGFDESLEIRGVETVEEFFRPEFIHNIQFLDEDGSDNSEFNKTA